MKVQGGPPLSKKKTHQLLLLFCVNAKNGKSGFNAFGAVFSIKKVERDKLMKS